MNPGSIEIFDLNTTHNYSRNIKAENPKQSVVYLTILWLECDCAFRLEMFHNLFHDISLVNAKIFKLCDSREIPILRGIKLHGSDSWNLSLTSK